MTKTLTIGGTADRKLVEVRLVGVTYKVKPVKAANAMKMAKAFQGDDEDGQYEALMDWIDSTFRTSAAKVKARLEDENDDLDITHVLELMGELMKISTGRPTSLPSA